MKDQTGFVQKKRPSLPSSRHNGKNDHKRRRAAQPIRGESEGRLLQILTGADDETPQEAKSERQANLRAPNTQHTNSEAAQTPEHDATDNNNLNDDDDDDNNNRANDDDAAASDKPPIFTWQHALSQAHANKINVTVLLANANLETVKQAGRSGGLVLLNCEDHKNVLRKSNRDANDARPDITHQCLLALMDSPLNKAGRLKVYIRTVKNVLIEVHPQTRIPRTIRRFSGLMAELLEKFKVRGTSGSVPLLKVIRNPIISHLPVGTRKVICTYNSDNMMDMREHAAKMTALAVANGADKNGKASEEEIAQDAETVNVLYVIGAMAHGKVVEDWADEYICISEYPLSAATVCSRLAYAYECLLGIV